MRKLLRAFLAWADKRWPEKVVITQTEFLKMQADLKKILESSSEARLKAIESEINKFNMHMGFGGSVIPKGMAQEFKR